MKKTTKQGTMTAVFPVRPRHGIEVTLTEMCEAIIATGRTVPVLMPVGIALTDLVDGTFLWDRKAGMLTLLEYQLR